MPRNLAVTAEGAERRPLGDPRPIREADVWLNMGRNLSRQPEQESALAFMEKAHAVRHAATATLQAGLQPAEQRAADCLVPTTLALRQRRIGMRVAEMAERLGRSRGLFLISWAFAAGGSGDGCAGGQ